MFGATIFIPLFLQLVYGASPTSSGLRMLPLMAGLLVASILSGRAISKIGRCKAFPIAGTAILVGGMYLLSRLTVGTAPWLASIYMLIVGTGIGLVMQVLVPVAHSLSGVFIWGMAMAVIPFGLSWLLKEVPLRTTVHSIPPNKPQLADLPWTPS